LHQRTRTTTVYVTHDQVEAMTLGDRIAVMKDGVVQQFGTPEEIYSRPATRFVAEFIGSPTMNFFAARAEGTVLSAGSYALPANDAQSLDLQDLLYGLRPEDIRLADRGLAGSLLMIEPTGPETYVLVDTALGKLTARVPGTLRGRVGDAVHLQWSAKAAHLFDPATEKRLA